MFKIYNNEETRNECDPPLATCNELKQAELEAESLVQTFGLDVVIVFESA